MTALVGQALLDAMTKRPLEDALVVTPMLDQDKQVGPGSIDLRLGTDFLQVSRHSQGVIDPFGDDDGIRGRHPASSQQSAYETRTVVPLGEKFVLHPGHFVLGATLEFLALPKSLVGQVLSRSSWGRLGLIVATAVTVQPGFRGVLTLELANMGDVPMVLRPGLRIAQLCLWQADGQTLGYTQGKYSTALGAQSNKLAWEAPERERLRRLREELR